MRKYEDTYRHKGLRKKLMDVLRDKGITDEQVLAIRGFHIAGMSNVALARMFNVDRRTIFNVVKRKSWTHI